MQKTDKNSNPRTIKKSLAQTQQGIMVLGMHRSGTSAVARTLNLLGCAISDDLIGSGPGNEKGHWEASDLVSLNDEMLDSAGTVWNDFHAINEDWRSSAVYPQMISKASEVLREHAALGPLFVYKDPRTSRVADVWLEASRQANVAPLAVIMVRNPAEVEASLEKRDLMSEGHAGLLWLRYTLDAEYLTRGNKRTFGLFDRLLQSWREFIERIKTDLDVSFPRNSAKVHRELDKFLEADEQHHEINHHAFLKDPRHSQWVRDTFSIMLRWSLTREDKDDYETLDQIRSDFNRAVTALSRAVKHEKMAGEAGSGAYALTQLEKAKSEANRLNEILSDTERNLAEHRTASAERESELKDRVEKLTQSFEALKQTSQAFETEASSRQADGEAQLLALQSENQRLRVDQATLRKKAKKAQKRTQKEEKRSKQESDARDRAEAEKSELQRELQTSTEELKTALRKYADIESQVREAQRENASLRLEKSDFVSKIALLESTSKQREEELSQVWASLREAEKETKETKQKEDRTSERNRVLERRLSDSEASHLNEMSRSSAELAELTRLLRELESELDTAREQGNFKEKELQDQINETENIYERTREEVRKIEDSRRLEAVKLQSVQNELERTTSELDARFSEIARMTALLNEGIENSQRIAEQSEFLRDIAAVSEGFPKWWAIMPTGWRRRREHDRFRKAGLFDADVYLGHYPDVAQEGMDPVRHYIMHGMLEGRICPK